MIKEVFDIKNGKHVSSGKFAVSSIGACWRRKWQELKGIYKEDYTAKTLFTFAAGDAFHRLAVKTLMEKGDSIGIRVASAEVDIPEHPYISGRADLIVSDGKELMVVDIKSASDWTLNKAIKGEVPQNYKDQVNLYLHFFNLKRGFLVFIGKHKSVVEEYEILYDKARAEALISEIEAFYKQYVIPNIEPPACDGFAGGPFPCPVCGKEVKT